MTELSKHDSAFSLDVRDDGIAVLRIDVPHESMNTLKVEFVEQIEQVLSEINGNSAITGVVVISGKPSSFIAGADISMLDACSSSDDATAIAQSGQQIFQQIEEMHIPFVAAIHGPALGGGLELALACHKRVCSDDENTQLGLPEVQLGLLPGSGGTQRLPALIGIQQSMKMMLTGSPQRPKQALKCGLVDDVVPESVLLDVAVNMAKAGKSPKRTPKLSLVNRLLEQTGPGRNMLFKQARKQTQAKTLGNYPAPLYIIECIEQGVQQGFSQGLKLESQRFGELVMTPESVALRSIFFATTEMKKEWGVEGVSPAVIRKIAVLGGGLMGGGIAYVSAIKAGLAVRIKDIQAQGIANAMRYSFDILNKKLKRRFIKKSVMQKQLALLTGTTDYSGFSDADVVIEAVFEDLELKQSMVADVEQHCQSSTIFASNTSSLPIGDIAKHAARPQNVIGLHYFSPVDKMPLAEIIAHDKTSDQTISTTVDLARKQGKTPIVVKDGAGFYVNRILAPYINEAAEILMSGEPVEHIDQALRQFGFPVGPLKLLDEVGIDVGTKIGPILQQAFGDRFASNESFDKLNQDQRKGKKNKRGFYDYHAKPAGKKVDDSIYSLLGVSPSSTMSPQQIAERSVLLMLNEAAICLDQGVIRNARDGDIGAIFGIGFPPFHGGPFKYMDALGISEVVARLEHYQSLLGDKYTPCELLRSMSEDQQTFY